VDGVSVDFSRRPEIFSTMSVISAFKKRVLEAVVFIRAPDVRRERIFRLEKFDKAFHACFNAILLHFGAASGASFRIKSDSLHGNDE